jgi:osmotically-inducible protein OsmY
MERRAGCHTALTAMPGGELAVSQPKMSPQDESLWFKVRIALRIDPETAHFSRDLVIRVHRGQVTLEGKVPSAADAAAAQRVALAVPDVYRVVNNLTHD